MQTKNNQLVHLIWPDCIVILLLAGTIFLTIKAQTPTQEFLLGVLTGMLVVYFAVFTYNASQVFLGKQS